MKRLTSLLDFVRRSKLGFDITLGDIALLAIAIAQAAGNPITETRLHKVLTIVERELKLGVANLKPHYFGPYIPELRDALEGLRKNSYIEIEERSRETSDFGYPYIKVYKVTKSGEARARELADKLARSSLGKRILKLLELWAPARLDVVLYYVYTKYPDLTDRSVIKDRVLGHSAVT